MTSIKSFFDVYGNVGKKLKELNKMKPKNLKKQLNRLEAGLDLIYVAFFVAFL